MSWKRELSVTAVALAVTCQVVSIPAYQQARSRTIWDGVFSQAQAERGKRSYESACGYCHRDDLSGGGGDEPGMAPPELQGASFIGRWAGASVADLLGVIATTMPFQRPKLQSEVYRDIVSYILQVNGAASGESELSDRIDELRAIAIVKQAAN